MNDDADRERVLAEVLAGDLDADAAEVVARCARDPEFAAALADLLQVQHRLAARGAMVREDLATPAPELEDVAERTLRALVPREQGVRRRRVWPWLAAAVAAATIAAAVLSWPRSTPDSGDQILGGGFPVEAIDDRTLRFRHVLAPNEHFFVTIVDASGNVVAPRERLDKTTWSPGSELLARWEAGWRVKVVAESSDGGTSYGRALEGWPPPR